MQNMDWSKPFDCKPHTDDNMGHFRTVKGMDRAAPHLNNVQELLKNAIFLQQQLKYEQGRKAKRDTGSSLYQRFSAHLSSVDLPDLPVPEIRSETVIPGASGGARSGT